MKCVSPLAVLSIFFLTGAANAAETPAGDVYVTLADGTGSIFIDGVPTGISAPGMVHGVSAGPHTVRVDQGCRTATADLSVRTNAIERVSLALATGNGTAAVSTVPYGAAVTEGGTLLGNGPFGPITLACGAHTVVTKASGRQSTSYTFEVPLRGHIDVKIELPPAALGAVAITPTPLDATVWVDGSARGTGPMTIDSLPAGVHTVGARLDGYQPTDEQVTIVADQIVRASVELVAKPPPVSFARRTGLDRVRWGRVGLDAGATLLSAGIGVFSWYEYHTAETNYATYATLHYDEQPDLYYSAQIAEPRTMSFVLGGVAAAGTVTSGVLWATTHPRPAPSEPVAPAQSSPAVPAPAAVPAKMGAPAPVLELSVAPTVFGAVLIGRF